MEVRDAFNFDDLSADEIHKKLQVLSGKGRTQDLSDEELAELVQLSRTLRRRSSGPPKANSRKKKGPITDNDLLA